MPASVLAWLPLRNFGCSVCHRSSELNWPVHAHEQCCLSGLSAKSARHVGSHHHLKKLCGHVLELVKPLACQCEAGHI
eukprot:6304078-Alexandrium_andersonii.AAC.1